MLKVSVIIPVYNTEKYIRKCLDSVCNQTLSDIEIICINDCSTDNSLYILKEYALNDSRVKIIDFNKNRGAAIARNAGIDEAIGEYISFIDSDDYPDLDFYEKLYNKAIETNADCAKGNYRYIKTNTIPDYLNRKIMEDKNNFSFAYCSAIFKKSVLDRNNIKFPELCDMEDPIFTYKFALIANKIELVDTYVNITTREDSQTLSLPNIKRIKDRIEGLNIIIDLANISDISKESYSFICAFWIWSVFANSIKADDQMAIKFLIDSIFSLIENIKYKDLFYYELSEQDIFFKNCIINKNLTQLLEFKKFHKIDLLRKNMKKNKISIIIPVYNAKEYIERCLDSVVNQTLRDIEIICINDCSTDSSLDILKKFAAYDDRIKIYNNYSNLGESKTRNIGINHSTGEYIAFLDNDDFVDNDFYEKLYNVAKVENADIAKADVKIYSYDQKNILKGWTEINSNIEKYGDKMYFALYWWTAIYRATLIKENHILLPEDMILGGDIVFLNKAVINANKVVLAKNTYYNWKRRENSGDSAFLNDKKVESVLKAYKTVLMSLNDMPLEVYNENSYIFVYNMFLSGIFETIFKNNSVENKIKCVELMFSMYEECKLQSVLQTIFLKKYPKIKDFLKNGQRNEMIEFILSCNTEKDIIFKNLRERIG